MFTYHDKQTIHSSRILISYFHLSQKLKALKNPVSRNNPFHPLIKYTVLNIVAKQPTVNKNQTQ